MATLRRRDGRAALTIHDLDDLDRQIVAHLQENGRRSNVAIARALRVTETTVRHRIERLIAGGFIRIAAVIDPRRTAYQVDAIIWAELERGRALGAAEAIARLPNVVYVGLTTGRYDVLIEALFETDDELFEFLTRKLSRRIGIVRSETYRVIRTVKINYDWKVPLDHWRGTARTGRYAARRRPPTNHQGG
jgi:Lrp/AsnC family transcriptional regulator for asnA, asnC and gidA